MKQAIGAPRAEAASERSQPTEPRT